MIYFSQMLGMPVIDSTGEQLGTVSDLAIATGEVFPRITSVAFRGPGKTPFMISWRKYVGEFADDRIVLNVDANDVRFSYLQPNEILVARDLLDKQIVDTQGLKIVRVNDIKLSVSRSQLRLLGAEVGPRGLLRGLSPKLEKAAMAVTTLFKHPLQEELIAWSYMDLLDRDLSQVKLSVTHKRLHELHPADVADIIEQLDPQQRTAVFEHLDNAQAAEAISELEDEYQADIIDDLDERRASQVLAEMDPDDAADIVGDLPYEKAEQLLRIMGVEEEKAIRRLLGYKENTAGGIMTNEFFAVPESTTVAEVVEQLRRMEEEQEHTHYVYTVEDKTVDASDEDVAEALAESPLARRDAKLPKLTGVVTMRRLVLANATDRIGSLAHRDLITASPEDDQEEVAEAISKYNLLAMPVVDEDTGGLLGIVTVDDAFDVLEEEHDEDLALAGIDTSDDDEGSWMPFFRWFMRREMWFIFWIIAIVASFLTGHASTLHGALLFMPLVLLIADDVATYAKNDLIDEDDEERTFGVMFARDLAIGLAVAVLAGLISEAALGVMQNADINDPVAFAIGTSIQQAVIPSCLAIFATILLSILFSAIVKRRKEKGKIASDAGMTAIAMIIAVAIQIGLSFALSGITLGI